VGTEGDVLGAMCCKTGLADGTVGAKLMAEGCMVGSEGGWDGWEEGGGTSASSLMGLGGGMVIMMLAGSMVGVVIVGVLREVGGVVRWLFNCLSEREDENL
jgi:hypothetical protein